MKTTTETLTHPDTDSELVVFNRHPNFKGVHDITVAKKMLQIHDSAKKRKIPFNMTFRKVKVLLMQKKCFYTGTVFDDTPNNRLSFDRIDSDLGYTDDNVVACTINANQLKANMSAPEIMSLALKLVKLAKAVDKIKPASKPKASVNKLVDAS